MNSAGRYQEMDLIRRGIGNTIFDRIGDDLFWSMPSVSFSLAGPERIMRSAMLKEFADETI